MTWQNNTPIWNAVFFFFSSSLHIVQPYTDKEYYILECIYTVPLFLCYKRSVNRITHTQFRKEIKGRRCWLVIVIEKDSLTYTTHRESFLILNILLPSYTYILLPIWWTIFMINCLGILVLWPTERREKQSPSY